jgi:hypothetical protein
VLSYKIQIIIKIYLKSGKKKLFNISISNNLMICQEIWFLKLRYSLYNSSYYFSLFRLLRTEAKSFIVFPMAGWFGKRLAFLKFSAFL